MAKIVGCLLQKSCVPLVAGIDGVGLTDSIDLACVLENSYSGFLALCRKVHIEFTEGEDKITLEGPTEDVNVAQEQIEVMVKDLVSCWC